MCHPPKTTVIMDHAKKTKNNYKEPEKQDLSRIALFVSYR